MSTQNTTTEAGPIRKILDEAIIRWETLTGVNLNQTRWTGFAEWDLRQMNDALKQVIDFEPNGETALLMLEVFLRTHLEGKTFTAAQIMKDYAATTDYLQKAETLFSMLQGDAALEMAANFRQRVIDAVRHYGGDRDDVLELINDPDALPFLRRNALRAMGNLKAHQFLSGEPDTGIAQVIDRVHLSWNINDLLIGVRDMPISGVALVMLRDAARPDLTYFAFAMRNGGNVTLFVDRKNPAYPGQDEVLGARGGRGLARSFAQRSNANHFPYQILKTSLDDRGDVIFDAETAPVAIGPKIVPLMRIADLPADQVIWTVMMFSLISERFWHQRWQAPALSYTAAMIRNKTALVEDAGGSRLPAAAGYRPIELEEILPEEVTYEAMAETLKRGNGGGSPQNPQPHINAWLEERYSPLVTKDVLNQWDLEPGTILCLPELEGGKKDSWDRTAAPKTSRPGGLVVYDKKQKDPFAIVPTSYKLSTFAPTDFGTEEELRKDRLYIARNNQAAVIQRAADEEFRARKAEIETWFKTQVTHNTAFLCEAIIAGPDQPKPVPGGGRASLLSIYEKPDEDFSGWRYRPPMVRFGYVSANGRVWKCPVTDASAFVRYAFTPRDPSDIAALAGCDVTGLPDVIRNWRREKPYVGNHLLDRIDPMLHRLQDPWMKLHFCVSVFLSKSGLKKIKSGEVTSLSLE